MGTSADERGTHGPGVVTHLIDHVTEQANGDATPNAATPGSTVGTTQIQKRTRTVQLESETAYASQVPIDTCNGNSTWIGALIARKDIKRGDVISRYTGPTMTVTEYNQKRPTSEYLFTATNIQRKNMRWVIDGDPTRSANLAGYANYAPHKHANANFEDRGQHMPRDAQLAHNVVLVAKDNIPAGQEIRVDYDMGAAGHPFRDNMIRQKGITAQQLNSTAYKQTKWEYPVPTSDDSNLPIAQTTRAPGNGHTQRAVTEGGAATHQGTNSETDEHVTMIETDNRDSRRTQATTAPDSARHGLDETQTTHVETQPRRVHHMTERDVDGNLTRWRTIHNEGRMEVQYREVGSGTWQAMYYRAKSGVAKAGWGLFAARRFNNKEYVALYAGKDLGPAGEPRTLERQAKLQQQGMADHVMEIGGRIIDGKQSETGAQYMNSAKGVAGQNENVTFSSTTGAMKVIATKGIEVGEEMFQSYGGGYWNQRAREADTAHSGGFIAYSIHRQQQHTPGTSGSHTVMYVEELAVSRAVRGKGQKTGRRLMQKALHVANAIGVEQCHLIVRGNTKQQQYARELYRELGMQSTRDKQRQIYEPGAGQMYMIGRVPDMAHLVTQHIGTHNPQGVGWQWRYGSETTQKQDADDHDADEADADARNMDKDDWQWARAVFKRVHTKTNGGDGQAWRLTQQEGVMVIAGWDDTWTTSDARGRKRSIHETTNGTNGAVAVAIQTQVVAQQQQSNSNTSQPQQMTHNNTQQETPTTAASTPATVHTQQKVAATTAASDEHSGTATQAATTTQATGAGGSTAQSHSQAGQSHSKKQTEDGTSADNPTRTGKIGKRKMTDAEYERICLERNAQNVSSSRWHERSHRPHSQSSSATQAVRTSDTAKRTCGDVGSDDGRARCATSTHMYHTASATESDSGGQPAGLADRGRQTSPTNNNLHANERKNVNNTTPEIAGARVNTGGMDGGDAPKADRISNRLPVRTGHTHRAMRRRPETHEEVPRGGPVRNMDRTQVKHGRQPKRKHGDG